MDRLEDGLLAEATKGLKFDSGLVIVTSRKGRDRKRAVDDTAAANRSLNTENSGFKAAAMFRDAILADPTYSRAFEGFGRSMLMVGETKIAIAAFRSAISLDNDFGRARFELGAVLQGAGDYAGAVEAWQELVKRQPDYPEAFSRMAIASYFGQNYQSAWKYLEQADKRKQKVPPQFRELLRQAAPQP
jgi:tetratricopeptide (TPR) repeat protein